MNRKARVCGMVVLGVLVGMAKPALAQEKEMSADEQAMMAKWAQYSTPSEAHGNLAEAAGDWEYTMTWWMQPGAAPERSSGTSKSEMILGGRYLEDKVRGTAMGQPFEGRGTTGYDNYSKEYISTWVDNMGTGVFVSRGKYDPAAKSLVMTGTMDDFMDGKKKTMRSVLTHVDQNTTRFEMYAPGPDGKEFKTMEMVSKRQKVSGS